MLSEEQRRKATLRKPIREANGVEVQATARRHRAAVGTQKILFSFYADMNMIPPLKKMALPFCFL
ncbi:hypothetical protein HMPREF1567_2435 [Providencia alcalifaciens PAL-2]|nr:hypothetical protein HMPREF1562_2488 [Providencia alcalifaciens F90-2004]EUC94262.1 hypothetical protein HMPREF1567_2435 [Providencia alcalifaciens PAL-2]